MSTEQPAITENSSAFAKMQASKREALDFYLAHPQELTLDNALAAGIEIFVRNNLSGDRPGRLAVDFTIAGRKVVIPVYNISIAIRLNDYMPAEDIGSSGSLRDMLYKGALVLVHPDTAKKEWESARGQRELARFRSSLAKTENAPTTAARVPVGDMAVKEGLVSDRMKSFVIEYEALAKVKGGEVDLEAKQEVLDRVFANNRSFNMADVEYFQKSSEGDQTAQDVAFELMGIVGGR